MLCCKNLTVVVVADDSLLLAVIVPELIALGLVVFVCCLVALLLRFAEDIECDHSEVNM